MSADDPTPAEGESATGRTDEQPVVSLPSTAEEAGPERLAKIAAADMERATDRLGVGSRMFQRGEADVDTLESYVDDVITASVAFRIAVRTDGGGSGE
jgi:hypothetical protein